MAPIARPKAVTSPSSLPARSSSRCAGQRARAVCGWSSTRSGACSRHAAGPPHGRAERRRRLPRGAGDVAAAASTPRRGSGPASMRSDRWADGRDPIPRRDPRLRIVADDATARRSTVLRVGGGEVDELHLVLAARDRRPAGDVLRDWLRARARATIEREIERRAPALGVTPVAVTVRDQRTRWGSASQIGTPVAVLAPRSSHRPRRSRRW